MYNITESDYSFVESNNVEFYGVRLLSGKWRNVVYIYWKVSIKESPELDQATISFTYSVQEEGNFEEDDLINDPEFKNYIGAILQHIMEANLGKGTIGKSNTNTHTKSSN